MQWFRFGCNIRLHFWERETSRPWNRIERLDEGGPVFGILPSALYSAGPVDIQSFYTLALYSDGVSEATSASDEEFREERIEQMVLNAADCTPGAVCEQITDQVSAFAGTESPADDRTLLVVKFLSRESATRDDVTTDEESSPFILNVCGRPALEIIVQRQRAYGERGTNSHYRGRAQPVIKSQRSRE